MARLPRLAIAGAPHLVVQRGDGVTPLFIDDTDRRHFMTDLSDMARACGVEVHAYALLDHEARMLATPREAPALGLLMQRVGRRYVARYNRRHGRVGALWAGRFQASVVDASAQLMTCLRWIERAPVVLGWVERAEDWPWSSAAHHTGAAADALIREHRGRWAFGNTPFERDARHRFELLAPLTDAEERSLTYALRGGWPLGGADFADTLAAATTRPLAPRPRGRPRRQPAIPLD